MAVNTLVKVIEMLTRDDHFIISSNEGVKKWDPKTNPFTNKEGF